MKPNHALLLGGGSGIGKDWLLAPVRSRARRVNFQDFPGPLYGTFNAAVRAVVMRVNEAHDLGDSERPIAISSTSG